jgi:hypothetical protein
MSQTKDTQASPAAKLVLVGEDKGYPTPLAILGFIE